MNFTWNGKEIITIGDVGRAVCSCTLYSEAESFLREYVKHINADDPNERLRIAKSNIGYLAGYYSVETRNRIFNLFSTEHPIFGTKDPTPKDAFEAGKIIASKGSDAARKFLDNT
jgi:hypothetical protein